MRRSGGMSFFQSRSRHTKGSRDWSSDVCSSDLFARRAAMKIDEFGKVDEYLTAANEPILRPAERGIGFRPLEDRGDRRGRGGSEGRGGGGGAGVREGEVGGVNGAGGEY